MLTCPKCLGTGSLSGSPCPTCLGHTVVSPVVLTCPACTGTGAGTPPYSGATPPPCAACDGNGSIVHYTAYTDPLPPPYPLPELRETLDKLIAGAGGALPEHQRGFAAGLILRAGAQTRAHRLPAGAHLSDLLDQPGRLLVAADGIYHDPGAGALPVRVFTFEEGSRV